MNGSSRIRALAFDTSGPFVAAGCSAGRSTSEKFVEMQRGQAEALFPILEACLEDLGVAWKALEALGVCVGPGNFTGIRIAIASARGLGLSLECPVFGFTTFDLAAPDWVEDGPTLVTLPAPRGTCYAQVFQDGAAAGPPMQLDPKAPPRDLGIRSVVGSCAHEIGAALNIPARPETYRPDPARLLALTCQAFENAKEFPPAPAPLYLRPADAAPPKTPQPTVRA